MATICALADAHLGYRHRNKKQRLHDYQNSYLNAINQIKKQKPDLFIILGDLFHHPRPDPTTLKTAIKTLTQTAQKTPTILCIGNHEISGHLSTSYTPLFHSIHPNIRTLTHQQPHITIKIKNKKIGVHGFQYLRDKKTTQEQLNQITQEITGENDYDILCLHQAIQGYLEPHELSLRNLRQNASKYDLILFGHVHKHQKITEINDITPTYYIGSTEKTSFNEADNTNGFMVFHDFDFQNPQFIKTKSASMKKINLSLGKKTAAEINQHIEDIIKKHDGIIQNLQINLKTELTDEYMNLRQDYHTQYNSYTILDVNIMPASAAEIHTGFQKKTINEDLIKEYFTQTGMKKRNKLQQICVELYTKYGK